MRTFVVKEETLTMKKHFAITLLGMIFSSSAFSFIGKASNESEVELGSFVYHLRELVDSQQRGRNNYYKPMLLFSKQGFIAGYFKNSHDRDTVTVGIRRYWPVKKKGTYSIVPGYSLGIVRGYCHGKKGFDVYRECEKDQRPRISPFAQVFLKARMDNVSLNLSYSLVLLYATVSMYF